MSKEIDIKKVAKIAKEQRGLVELFKKGTLEGISDEDYLERQLKVINKLEELCDMPKSYWSKDENGEPILAQEV